jgi:hypothetical protein
MGDPLLQKGSSSWEISSPNCLMVCASAIDGLKMKVTIDTPIATVHDLEQVKSNTISSSFACD